MNTQQMASLSDDKVIWFYEDWSEKCWATEFMNPDVWMVQQFTQWLASKPMPVVPVVEPRESYEIDMLRGFRLLVAHLAAEEAEHGH